MSKKREEKIARDNAAFAARVKEAHDEIRDKYAAIKKIEDPAEKIIALDAFRRVVGEKKQEISDIEEMLVRGRAGRSAATIGKRVLLTGLCCMVVFLPDVLKADWTAKSSQSEERKKLYAATGVQPLLHEINDTYPAAVRKDLTDTLAQCDLAAVADSPHFTRVYKRYDTLRERFEAVVAAQAARDSRAAAKKRKAPAQKGKTPQRKKGL